MGQVGSGTSGKVLTAKGSGASPKFENIGTDSGLTSNGLIIAKGLNSFEATDALQNGQIVIGKSGDSPVAANLSAGPGVSITNGSGSITIGLSGSGQAIDSITNDSGTNPVTPDLNGNVNFLGSGSITSVASTNTTTLQLTGLTNHTVLVGAGTTTITKVGPGSAGQVLRSGGASADPSYSTATYPSTTNANRILYSSSANTIGEITSANNRILSTDGSGVPSFGTSLSSDYTFTSSTASATRVVNISNTDNTSGTSNAGANIATGGTSSGDPYTRYTIGTSRCMVVGIDNSDSQSFKINTEVNSTCTPSTGNNIYKLTTGGNRTLPLSSCVNADLSTTTTNATGDGTGVDVIFNSDTGNFFDQNGNYDTTTGVFTAPVTGKYLVCSALTYTNLGASHTSGTIRVNFNGSVYAINTFNPYACSTGGEYTAQIAVIVPLTVGGTINTVGQVSGGTKTVGIKGNSFGSYSRMSVNLIC